MPSRNRIKTYIDNSYYHFYNRGVNKRNIFVDKQDYDVFLSYLKTYLSPKNVKVLLDIIASSASSSREKYKARMDLNRNNFCNRIELIAYCLMTNHYHFLLKTADGRDIEVFMKSLMTRYTKYFNKRHKRIGPLFQDRYKAILIKSDEQLLYLTRYIHRNPIEIPAFRGRSLKDGTLEKQPSSYAVYLEKAKEAWVHPYEILTNFSTQGFNSYQSFVESSDTIIEEKQRKLLNLTF